MVAPAPFTPSVRMVPTVAIVVCAVPPLQLQHQRVHAQTPAPPLTMVSAMMVDPAPSTPSVDTVQTAATVVCDS